MTLGEQIRLSARSGMGSTLPLLLMMLVMIPLSGGLNWILTKHRGDWKAGLVVGLAITFLWFLWMSTSTFVDIRRTLARGQEILQSFPAGAFFSGLYGGGLVLAAVIVIGTHREGDPLWVQLTPLVVFGVPAFFGWPRPIHCDGESLWQRSRWGVKTRIRYADIISLASRDGSVFVTGTNGTIEHTPYHFGSELFQILLEERTGEEVSLGAL